MAKEREKTAIERLNASVRHPLRREIMLMVAERDSRGETLSPDEARKELGFESKKLSHVSYQFSVLRNEGAIKLVDQLPRRGAVSNRYKPNPAFAAEIVDTAALDQIAELIDGFKPVNLERLGNIIRSTGRPVEA